VDQGLPRGWGEGVSADSGGDGRRTLLLSFDFEDCDQLLGRSFGAADWDRRWPGFERQFVRVLELLDSLRASATFFVLGITARNYPDLVRELATRGEDLAIHGFEHAPVFRQTRDEFRRDVTSSLELLESISGRRAIGYRAPAFSLTRETPWALEALAELGIRYDSSLYDSPRHPRRLGGIPPEPCPIAVADGHELWELPVAVARWRGLRLPVGGGSYWRVLPASVLRVSLSRTGGEYVPLYFHPYECDEVPLHIPLPDRPSPATRAVAASYRLRAKPGWGTLPDRLRDVAAHFKLSTYGAALDQLERERARPRSLSAGRVVL
jgi:polysaccharide deacetylase family protein (PEP-CTERM system associated)